jgi:Protein of unknown function (DUF5818)
MKLLLVSVVAAASLGVAPSTATFVGTISDSMCANNHAPMRMGPTDAECTVLCHEEHDAAYVLWDGTHAYQLSDQDTPKRFAGKRVTVVGTLDAGRGLIAVESITAE